MELLNASLMYDLKDFYPITYRLLKFKKIHDGYIDDDFVYPECNIDSIYSLFVRCVEYAINDEITFSKNEEKLTIKVNIDRIYAGEFRYLSTFADFYTQELLNADIEKGIVFEIDYEENSILLKFSTEFRKKDLIQSEY